MRVLVCGGRDYRDRETFTKVMDAHHSWHQFTAVIHGGASGADHEAEVWAQTRGIPVLSFPADWDMHGKAAGPIRNRQMLEVGRPDIVIAFAGGRGTQDMARRARAAGIPVVEVGAASIYVNRKE
jgi:hypothetical protein